MKAPNTTKLSADIAVTLKEIIISAMPKKTHSISPMSIVMWIELRSIAKKIHTKLFCESKEISLSLSVAEELALYEFLLSDKEGTIVSLDSVFLNFLKSVDEKIKTNVFLVEA